MGVAYHRRMASPHPLRGIRIAITRPVGAGGPLARRVLALGGVPLQLPGSRLTAAGDPRAARAALADVLAGDVVIFTSPAAVRFARKLMALRPRGMVLAPGAGTLRALHRADVRRAIAPAREDSEGILALPGLTNVRGCQVGIVGAAGGRGLLDQQFAARGARVSHANVYQRRPARLDRRHAEALQRDPRKPLYALLSSVQALGNILDALPDEACRILLAGTAIASSDRLATAAREAGFARVLRAPSPHANAMLTAVVADLAEAKAKAPRSIAD